MSIEAKHAYRFGYLKSEQWQNVRLEALVREKAKCQICGEESISNDAHHIWYPENIYETKEVQLVVLCRTCHEFLHVMLPECKTGDEESGRAQWIKFRNAIVHWRLSKVSLFENLKESTPQMRQIGEAYDSLKNKCRDQESLIQSYETEFGITPTVEQPSKKFNRVRELGQAYDDLKKKFQELQSTGVITERVIPPQSVEHEIESVFKKMRKWASAYSDSVKREKEFVVEPNKEP